MTTNTFSGNNPRATLFTTHQSFDFVNLATGGLVADTLLQDTIPRVPLTIRKHLLSPVVGLALYIAPRVLASHLEKVMTNSLVDSEVSQSCENYPLVIFSHSLAGYWLILRKFLLFSQDFRNFTLFLENI